MYFSASSHIGPRLASPIRIWNTLEHTEDLSLLTLALHSLHVEVVLAGLPSLCRGVPLSHSLSLQKSLFLIRQYRHSLSHISLRQNPTSNRPSYERIAWKGAPVRQLIAKCFGVIVCFPRVAPGQYTIRMTIFFWEEHTTAKQKHIQTTPFSGRFLYVYKS